MSTTFVAVNPEILREGAPPGFAERRTANDPNDSGWRLGTAREEPALVNDPHTWLLQPFDDVVRALPAFAELVADPGEGASWVFEIDERRFVKLRLERGEPPSDVAILARTHQGGYLLDPTSAQLDYLLTRLEQPGHFLALTMDRSVALRVEANGDGTYRVEYRDQRDAMRTDADRMVKVRRLVRLWTHRRKGWAAGAGVAWTPRQVPAPADHFNRTGAVAETPAGTRSDPNHGLRAAAQRGDGEAIRRAIAAGADLEQRDSYGATPLHSAVTSASPTDPVRYGNPDGVRVLLDLGADPNARDRDGCSPLFRAIAGAARSDDLSVRLLLAAGADPDQADDKGWTPRSIIDRTPNYCYSGLLDVALRESRSALHHAAEAGDVDATQRLLADGTDPDVADTSGFTPLHAAVNGAARYQRQPVATTADVVELLLDAGADPNPRGGTKATLPLLTAMTIGGRRATDLRDRIIAALIAAGADPDLGMAGGRTAREIAAIRGDIHFD